MNSHQRGELRYFTFESFPNGHLAHAVYGRLGGVSPAPYRSLNMSISTGDSLDNVRENRRRAYAALQIPFESMATLWQVHGAHTVVALDGPCDPYTKADALVTDRTDVSLFLRFADCVPILLYDPVLRVVGMAHAGWRGTVAGMAGSVVRAMVGAYGCKPVNILAGIGPSIGPHEYAVGPEVVAAVEQTFPGPGSILTQRDGQTYLDLWAANARALREAGLREIEIAGICTATHCDVFFSHRGDGGQSGRFGAVIALCG